MKLPSVQLVAVFKGREIIGIRWHGGHLKVRVVQGVGGVNARSPVESEEFFEERYSP